MHHRDPIYVSIDVWFKSSISPGIRARSGGEPAPVDVQLTVTHTDLTTVMVEDCPVDRSDEVLDVSAVDLSAEAMTHPWRHAAPTPRTASRRKSALGATQSFESVEVLRAQPSGLDVEVTFDDGAARHQRHVCRALERSDNEMSGGQATADDDHVFSVKRVDPSKIDLGGGLETVGAHLGL